MNYFWKLRVVLGFKGRIEMVAQISCESKYVCAYVLIDMSMDIMQFWDWMNKPFFWQGWMDAMNFLLNAQIW